MTYIQMQPATEQHGPDTRIEIIAGTSTYLALSYIFVLNPVMLSRAGIDISAAFFGTVISATIATLIMGLWARLPFAVAPAPSITTFFVSYVCIELGLSWPAALGAVFWSGVLSIAMAAASIRSKLIASVPQVLQFGILFAISGFLVANGLSQAKLIQYSSGFLQLSSAPFRQQALSAGVLCVGLGVTLVFRIPQLRFAGAPLLGILAASMTAAVFGITSQTKAQFSWAMLSATLKADIFGIFDPRYALAMLVFFVIDFFGGVGKYLGLFAAMGASEKTLDKQLVERALYTDGIGNIVGSIFGASSLAVFVSSTVGIVAGGRTGITAVVTATLMLLSLALIPLIGAVPVEATSGILVFVGLLLMPYQKLRRNGEYGPWDQLIWLAAALLSFVTYAIDRAICLVFLAYAVRTIWDGTWREHKMLIAVSLLLAIAVLAQEL